MRVAGEPAEALGGVAVRGPVTDPALCSAKADVAQLAERVLGKDEVTSSILVIGSTRLAAARLARGRPCEDVTSRRPDRASTGSGFFERLVEQVGAGGLASRDAGGPASPQSRASARGRRVEGRRRE